MVYKIKYIYIYMDFSTEYKIIELLDKDYRRYKTAVLDLDDSFISEFENDPDKMWNTFIFGICNDNSCLVNCIKYLIKHGCNKEKVNKFFYNYLKMKHKCELGLFSWNEISELDIDLDAIKDTTTTYKFI